MTLDDAFRVDPVAVLADAQPHVAPESGRQLGELDGRARVQPRWRGVSSCAPSATAIRTNLLVVARPAA
ncbi:MAG: hypothetical protein U5L08_06685 [Xanthomonadales bacterium]|nr:hypothetical protein [Xanthomonadales bacterium]